MTWFQRSCPRCGGPARARNAKQRNQVREDQLVIVCDACGVWTARRIAEAHAQRG